MNPNKIIGKFGRATLGLALTGSLLIAIPPAYAATAATSHVITSAEAHDLISFAEQIQNRVQYHFGANDTDKLWFDCSSFTKYVFAHEGVNLRWGARLQYSDGIKIARNDLQPGDLVFFSTTATVNNSTTYSKIGHVGIYIGNGQVIHNISPKYNVRISSIETGWWNTHYVAAARVAEPAPAPSQDASSPSASGVVVRSVSFLDSPSLQGTRIRYLKTGETFDILSKVNKYWYQIKDNNGKIGYVTTLTKYVSVSSAPSTNAPTPTTSQAGAPADTSQTGSVVRSVSFLDSPSLQGTRIRYLKTGETFDILSKVNKYWYQIKDNNGKIGYVTTLTKYVSVSSAPSTNAPTPTTSQAGAPADASQTGSVVRSVSFLESPSLHGTRIRYLKTGETFDILNKVNKYWYQIKDNNGKIGYVTTLTKYVSV